MVPDGYHDFFLATAGVAGALIGLLFVAISVNPGGVAATTSAHLRARPAAALSAFLNPLIMSLLGLRPGGVGSGFLAISISSSAAMIGSIIYLLAEARQEGIRTVGRTLLSLVVQLAAYVVQAVAGFRLQEHPGRATEVGTVTITMLVLFATGIDRAWEFVGAKKVNLLSSVTETILHSAHPTETASDTVVAEERDDHPAS